MDPIRVISTSWSHVFSVIGVGLSLPAILSFLLLPRNDQTASTFMKMQEFANDYDLELIISLVTLFLAYVLGEVFIQSGLFFVDPHSFKPSSPGTLSELIATSDLIDPGPLTRAAIERNLQRLEITAGLFFSLGISLIGAFFMWVIGKPSLPSPLFLLLLGILYTMSRSTLSEIRLQIMQFEIEALRRRMRDTEIGS